MNPVLANKNAGIATTQLSVEVNKWDVQSTDWLTPDSLLAYIGAKLRGLDEQIQSLMQQERGTQTQMDLISVARATVDGGNLPQGSPEVKSALDSLDAAIASLPEGSPAREQLLKVRTDFANNANDGGMGPKERSDFAALVGNAGQTLSQASEMSMIRLNSVMSMRQSAIQMCTNMMSTMGQMMLGIAQNTGK
jgi:hypothetical protein